MERDEVTMSKLYEVVHGSPHPGLPRAFSGAAMVGLMSGLRDEIVKVATEEATAADRVTGVGSDGKQTQGAQRLEKYYKAFTTAGDKTTFNYADGLPGGARWCGIFTAWVLNTAASHLGLDYQVYFKEQAGINKISGTPLNFYKDGDQTDLVNLVPRNRVSYLKGDICLMKEQGVAEKFPSHHFIVADDPALAIQEGRLMRTVEGNYPDKGVGARHSVTTNQRAVLNYGFYQVFEPPPL